MRRPPDKPGSSTVSERDVESCNATLNTVFRGARQKPWMIATGTPVHPTPRRLSKPSLPPMQEQESGPAPALLLSPTPSGGESPVLSNNDAPQQNSGYRPPPPVQVPATSGLRSPAEVTGHATSFPQFHGRVHPQSSPSETSSNQGSPLLQTEHVQAATTSNMQSPQARERQQNRRPNLQEVPSPILISGSSVQTHAQIPSQRPGQDRRTALQGTQSPAVNPGSPAQAYAAPSLSQLPSSTRGRPQSAVPGQPARTQSYGTNGYSQVQSPSQPVLSPPDTLPGNPHAPHRPVPSRSNSERVSSPSSRQQQNYGQPNASPNLNTRHQDLLSQFPLLKPKIALIQAHIASAGGTQNLNNSLDRPRFQLLTDACDTQDIFYVVMHQIFCTWDYDHSQLLSIKGLPSGDVLKASFAILGQLIRDNQGMATNHLRWFSAFPGPLDFLWATSEAYQHVVADVGLFLHKLALQWGFFSNQCRTRRYPPLVDELVNGLGILSPILQSVVFTATRRNLGLSDDQFGPVVENLFNEDKKVYHQISAWYRTHSSASREELQQHNQSLASRYYELLYVTQPQARDSGRGAVTPLTQLPSETITAQLSLRNANKQSVRSSGGIDQVPRYQNRRGPDPMADQHPQPAPAMPVTNPPPVAMAQRPAGPTSQQPTYEASSPSSDSLAMVAPVSPIEGPPSVAASQVLPSQGQQPLHISPPVLRSNNNQGRSIPSLPIASQNRMDAKPTSRPQNRTNSVVELQRGQAMVHRAFVMLQNVQGQGHNQIPSQQLPTLSDQLHTPDAPNARVRQRRFPSEMQPRAAIHNHSSRMIRDALPRGNTRPQSQLQNSAGGRAPTPSGLGDAPRPGQMTIPVYSSIQPPIMRPLLPPRGYMRPNEAPNPGLTALHQAQAQSPILVPAFMLGKGDMPAKGQKIPRFYQCVKDFALNPSKIVHSTSVSQFTFVINEAALSLKAFDKPGNIPGQVGRGYERGSLQFRLRCVQAKENITAYSLAEWVLCDTAWPDTTFIKVNGEIVEIRRKAHHAKDLPIDITAHISPAAPGEASTNHIRVSTPKSSRSTDKRTYFVAVEVVEILDHSHIVDMCQRQHIPASQTLDGIKKALAGPPIDDDDDDDITMIVSDLSINLADPFTARIFDIPVRGDSCLHRECFDLETFLNTRKTKFVPQPTLVDVWKCPLCSADVRPYCLRVDPFFVDVRAKLAADDNLDAKAILVSIDGSWKPKHESPLKRKLSNLPGESDDEDEGPMTKQRILDRAVASRAASMEARQARENAARVVEVIELDDDDD